LKFAMADYKRYRHALLIIIVLSFLFLVRNLYIKSQFIDKQAAIELAQNYCVQSNAYPQKEPHNINSKLLVCGDLEEQTGWNACNTRHALQGLKVWYVSMEGQWLIYGPPNANGTNSAPIPFTHCSVLMDAITGEPFSVRNH
jgi:hypothetical protein